MGKPLEGVVFWEGDFRLEFAFCVEAAANEAKEQDDRQDEQRH